jgi:hypothetical protein
LGSPNKVPGDSAALRLLLLHLLLLPPGMLLRALVCLVASGTPQPAAL